MIEVENQLNAIHDSCRYFLGLVASGQESMAARYAQKFISEEGVYFRQEFYDHLCSIVNGDVKKLSPDVCGALNSVVSTAALSIAIKNADIPNHKPNLWALLNDEDSLLYESDRTSYKELTTHLQYEAEQVAACLVSGNLDLFEHLLSIWNISLINCRVGFEYDADGLGFYINNRHLPMRRGRKELSDEDFRKLLSYAHKYCVTGFLEGDSLATFCNWFFHPDRYEYTINEVAYCHPPLVSHETGEILNPEYLIATQKIAKSHPEFAGMLEQVPCYVTKDVAKECGAIFFEKCGGKAKQGEADLGFVADLTSQGIRGVKRKLVQIDGSLLRLSLHDSLFLGLSCPEGYGLAMMHVNDLNQMKVGPVDSEALRLAEGNVYQSLCMHRVLLSEGIASTIYNRGDTGLLGFFGASYSREFISGEQEILRLMDVDPGLKINPEAVFPYIDDLTTPARAVLHNRISPDSVPSFNMMQIVGSYEDVSDCIDKLLAEKLPKNKYTFELWFPSGCSYEQKKTLVERMEPISDWPFSKDRPSGILDAIRHIEIDEMPETYSIYSIYLDRQGLDNALSVVETDDDLNRLYRAFGSNRIQQEMASRKINNQIVNKRQLNDDFSL